MRRPPDCVVFVARTHWAVGAVMLGSIALLHLVFRDLPRIEVGARGYQVTSALAAVYLLAGTLVWFGAPLAQTLSRICALLYLPRPSFGFRIWDIMNSAEFRAHFARPGHEATGHAPENVTTAPDGTRGRRRGDDKAQPSGTSPPE